jgi:hypothetical protein
MFNFFNIGGLNNFDINKLLNTYKDLIDEVTKLGIKKDSLGNISIENLVGDINYGSYVNSGKDSYKAKRQVESTCYANAAAAVLHLANIRIVGRKVDDFFTIRKRIIDKYGWDGGNINKVLEEFSPFYNLKYRKVSEKEAIQAVNLRRPQIITFYLYDN